MNLSRRHLNAGQKAALAVELLPLLEVEAKQRQVEAGGNHGNQYVKVDLPVSQKFEQVANQKIEQPILQPEPKESPVLEKIKVVLSLAE